MSDYLPPIVTKLDGDISGLAKKLAEAESLVDKYGRNVEKTSAEHGKAAGTAGGKGLTDKLEEEIGKPTVADKPLSRLGDRVQRKFKEIGEKSGKDFADGVEREAKALEAKLASLATEFTNSGDFDLFKQYRETKDELGLVNKVRKEFEQVKAIAAAAGTVIGAALPGGGGGGDSGGGFLSGAMAKLGEFAGKIKDAFAQGASAGWEQVQSLMSDHKTGAAIAAGIVLAAPAIGAAVDSAILLGVGGGSLIAGIVAAAQDSRVKSAWSSMVDDVKRKFIDASTPLVDPLVKGADKFGAAFDRFLPGIERGMGRLAPVLDRLIDGVIMMVDRIGPGFSDAFDAALPLLDQVAQDLPILGQGISLFLEEIAAGGPGAVTFFHDMVVAVSLLIGEIGGLVFLLSSTWGLLSGAAKIAAGDLSGAMDIAGVFGVNTKGAFDKTAEGATHASGEIDKVKKSLSDFISEALRMQDSQLALQKGLFDVADAFDKNGSSIDSNTRLGLANREALQHQVEQIARWRQEQLDAGKAPAYVNSEVEKQIKLMYDDALAHHANKTQLDGLVGTWRTILELPSNKTFTTTHIARAVTEGHIGGPQRYGGIVRHAATGLITRPGIYEGSGDGATVMAERPTREEGFFPREGISDPDAYGLLSTMASWKGWSVDTGGGRGGVDHAPAPATGGSGSSAQGPQVLQLVVDGRVFYEQVVLPHANQFKLDNGFSGVT